MKKNEPIPQQEKPPQTDIANLSVVELYEIALDQQEQIVILIYQLQQAEKNVALIKAEIARRK